eukprot:174759-Amphidinium_carterae.2
MCIRDRLLLLTGGDQRLWTTLWWHGHNSKGALPECGNAFRSHTGGQTSGPDHHRLDPSLRPPHHASCSGLRTLSASECESPGGVRPVLELCG